VIRILSMAGALSVLLLSAAHAADYVPPKGDAWTRHRPAQEGFDPAKLKAAIDFAIAHETKFPAGVAFDKYMIRSVNDRVIDYQHDTVAVVRWIDNKQLAAFVRLLEASVRR